MKSALSALLFAAGTSQARQLQATQYTPVEITEYLYTYENSYGLGYVDVKQIYSPTCEKVIWSTTEDGYMAMQDPDYGALSISSQRVTVYDANSSIVQEFFREYPEADGFDCANMYPN